MATAAITNAHEQMINGSARLWSKVSDFGAESSTQAFPTPSSSNPDDDQSNDDQACSYLYEAVYRIVGQELDGDFETFVLSDAAAPVVAPATDAEIIDTVGGPDEDEKPAEEEPREVPTMVQTREYLRLL
ncbi:hypothetical protein HPB52_007847 [Rhipicephalus sanguineus]|uniref:Uncharacterized protein n=1 Tax=Rhipicephalus sanguineus TaxID=34632 RepID=A0A9D4QHE4_RHISA|nr:hypothetical protein HPB52_007847 [Rhipicephalus sanguineus]